MNQKAFLVATNLGFFRAGEAAEIVGVEFVTPKGHDSRACYRVRFHDGKVDWVPLSDTQNFKIISEGELWAGKVPKVTT